MMNRSNGTQMKSNAIEMSIPLPYLSIFRKVLFLSFFAASSLQAEVVYLNNFNQGLDADFSAGSPKPIIEAGHPVGITSGKQGVAFEGETVSEALDLGFSDPKKAAGVRYELPALDLRSGTIEFWVKTGFDWLGKAASPQKWDEYSFIEIPAKGGGHIALNWYNRFGSWLHFYIYDSEKDLQIGLHERNPHSKDMGIQTQPGVWHYVVVSWTPEMGRIFVDGKLVEEKKMEKPLMLGPVDGSILLGAGARPNGSPGLRAMRLLTACGFQILRFT